MKFTKDASDAVKSFLQAEKRVWTYYQLRGQSSDHSCYFDCARAVEAAKTVGIGENLLKKIYSLHNEMSKKLSFQDGYGWERFRAIHGSNRPARPEGFLKGVFSC